MRRSPKLHVSATILLVIGCSVSGCDEDKPVPVAQPAAIPSPAVQQAAVAVAQQEETPEKSINETVVKRFRPARDPFKSSFNKKRVTRTDGPLTHPLQQFSIGQLDLLGIIWGIASPVALVSTPTGDEYIVKSGTPVGTGDGKVVAILPDRVVIVERYYDYRGQLQTEKYEMVLANEGN